MNNHLVMAVSFTVGVYLEFADDRTGWNSRESLDHRGSLSNPSYSLYTTLST